MKNILFISCILLSTLSHAGNSSFFTSADKFLRENVSDGLVAYKAIKANPEKIESLYREVGEIDAKAMSPSERKAFYINAYNIIVIYQVSRYYPLKSPMDASGFFDGVKHKVAGEMVTLNALEIGLLLREFPDARVHFVLACAAQSCPKLASFAYMPGKLEGQLNDRTKKALNDPEWLIIDKSRKMASISRIFKWYERDFQNAEGSVLAFINKYRSEPIPQTYSIDYYEYNWQLNE